jgi:hypothetical protein
MNKNPPRKWLAIIVAAATGMAVMFLMGFIFASSLSEADTIDEVLGIIFGTAAASYFVTGFIAGIWTRQVGPGISAAILVVVINLVYSFASGNVEASFLGIVIALIFALVVGSLGAFIGKVIRGSEKKTGYEIRESITSLPGEAQAIEYIEKQLTLGKEKDEIVKEFVKQGWSVKSAWDLVAKAEQSIENYKKGYGTGQSKTQS